MKKKHCLKGFTVIELIVSMSLFLILVALATGTFIQALRTQKIVTELSAANDNATQAMEQMAREIRTGRDFSKLKNDSTLNLINYDQKAVTYKLIGETIYRCFGEIIDVKACANDFDFKPITASEVKISSFKFILNGEQPGDGLPPRVTIMLSVVGLKDKDIIKMNLQTTVSARILGS